MIKTPTRALLCIGLVLCLSGGLLMARQGIVKTTDGRTIEGDVNEQETSVMVSVKGVEMTIPRADVASVQYVAGIEQQYQQRLAKLPKDGDPAGHLALAKWLFENKQYDLSRTELDTVLRLDANNAEATTLYATVQSQMRLERLHPGGQPPAGAGTGVEPSGTTGAKPAGNTTIDRRYVTADDINVIRQMEWARDDKTVRVHLEGDVKKRFLNFSNGNAAEFQARTPTDQALTILSRGLPEMRPDVKIINDPAPLAEFRRTIQPILLTGCATSGCHGGTAAPGKFFLYNPADTDAAAYTNFYLLGKYRKMIDGADRRMIDRTFPAKSLLAQYALPADVAQLRHPEVPTGTAWRGIQGGFRNAQDVGARKLAAWMSSLVPFEPDYGITFALQDKSATQPASAPAVAPANPIAPRMTLPPTPVPTLPPKP